MKPHNNILYCKCTNPNYPLKKLFHNYIYVLGHIYAGTYIEYVFKIVQNCSAHC